MENRIEFLERRRTGVGGSDVAAILGLSPWRDVLDVFIEKTRPPQASEDENVDLLRGELLEPVAAEIYTRKTGRKIRRMPMRRHRENSWALVHADRQILSDAFNGTGILELKCPRTYTFRRILEEGMFPSYLLQTQWGMYVTGYDWGSMAAFNLESGPDPLTWVDVPYATDIMKETVQLCEHFWFDHVEKNVPPDPATWRAEGEKIGSLATIASTGDKVATLTDPEFLQAAESYAAAQKLVKDAEALMKERKAIITGILGEAGIEEAQSSAGKFYFRWQEGRRSLSRDRFKKIRPLDWEAVRAFLVDHVGEEWEDAVSLLDSWELDVEMFEKVGEPYRALRFYPNKEG